MRRIDGRDDDGNRRGRTVRRRKGTTEDGVRTPYAGWNAAYEQAVPSVGMVLGIASHGRRLVPVSGHVQAGARTGGQDQGYGSHPGRPGLEGARSRRPGQHQPELMVRYRPYELHRLLAHGTEYHVAGNGAWRSVEDDDGRHDLVRSEDRRLADLRSERYRHRPVERQRHVSRHGRCRCGFEWRHVGLSRILLRHPEVDRRRQNVESDGDGLRAFVELSRGASVGRSPQSRRRRCGHQPRSSANDGRRRHMEARIVHDVLQGHPRQSGRSGRRLCHDVLLRGWSTDLSLGRCRADVDGGAFRRARQPYPSCRFESFG